MIRHIKRNILKKQFKTNKIKDYWKALQEAKRANEREETKLYKAGKNG